MAKTNKDNQGIYCIQNKINGKKYYGSSVDTRKRIVNHKWHLLCNRHGNAHLQKSFNKYGIDNFKFYVVQKTSFKTREQLLRRQQAYIDNNLDGYNQTNAAGNWLSQYNTEMKQAILDKISVANTKMYFVQFMDGTTKQFNSCTELRSYFNINIGTINQFFRKCSNKLPIHSTKNKIGNIKKIITMHVRTQNINTYINQTSTQYVNAFVSGDGFRIDTKDRYNANFYLVKKDNKIELFVGKVKLAKRFNCAPQNINFLMSQLKRGLVPTVKSRFYGFQIKEITKQQYQTLTES